MANDLNTAADTVRAAASLPTREKGSILSARSPASGVPGWSVFEAQVRDIPVDELRWPRSIKTYEDMRRDTQIQGLLLSVFLPVRHLGWYVDPAQADEGFAREIAEDFGLPLDGEEVDDEGGPGIDFDDHARLALLALAIGHRFFEESGEIEGEGSAMRYRLRRLDDRPPSTIQRIDVSPNGDLLSIRVPAANPDVDGPYVDVPADRLQAHVWDREGANQAGRPLLYGLYRSWLLKDELIRGDAVMHRRFSGLPVVEQTVPQISEDTHEAAAAMAMRVRSGDNAGVSMPYGTRLRLLGVEGSLPNAIPSVTYHDQQMARAFMQMFAELGQNGNGGSRALGNTLMDHYALGVIAVAGWMRKDLMKLVKRIGVRNYGPDVKLPKIRFRKDEPEDISNQDLVSLIDAGAIVVDDTLEAQIRQRGNLVARNEAQPGRVPPRSTTVAAPAVEDAA